MKTPANISLIVGLAIPIVMVGLIAAAVLLPGQSLNPQTDFIYAVGPYPTYSTRIGNQITQHELSVKDGILTDSPTSYTAPADRYEYPPEKVSGPRFFLHRTASDTNEEISIEDAKKFKISTEKKSPEGLTVSFGQRSYGVFPFFGDGDNDRDHAYLSNEYASKEVSLISDVSLNMYSFQLVGWVIAEN